MRPTRRSNRPAALAALGLGAFGLAAAAGCGSQAGVPSTAPGFHGWCVNAKAAVYIVLEGSGSAPTLLAAGAEIQPQRVIALHAGKQLSYYPLPTRAIPTTMTARSAAGDVEPVYATRCITGTPPTA